LFSAFEWLREFTSMNPKSDKKCVMVFSTRRSGCYHAYSVDLDLMRLSFSLFTIKMNRTNCVRTKTDGECKSAGLNFRALLSWNRIKSGVVSPKIGLGSFYSY
jgi:hypothetical protein